MKIFDSCIYPNDYSETELKKLSKELKLSRIQKAILQLDSRKLIDHNKILSLLKKNKNLIASYGYNSNLTLNQNIKLIQKYNYRIVKIHPRYMNIELNNNFNYYDKIFKKLPNNIVVQWCSLVSWQENDLPTSSQLKFLNLLINKNKDKKIIIMHGGGPDL